MAGPSLPSEASALWKARQEGIAVVTRVPLPPAWATQRTASSARQLVGGLLAAVLLLTSGANAAATGSEAAAVPGSAALVSQPTTVRQVALGMTMSHPDLPTFDAFAASVGRAPALWSLSSDWGGTGSEFPDSTLLDGLSARGAAPFIWWIPDGANSDTGEYRYSQIIAGAFDDYIRTWATAAKDWGGTVLVRLAPEMNATWFPWGMHRFNNTPKRFVKAWRHIWNIFRGPNGVGATNVKFVWSPYAPCANLGCTSYAPLYPGDKYVDYAGFSEFNWGGSNWWSMKKTFAPSMRALAAITSKPVIVAETGSSRHGGDKTAWVANGYPAVYKKFPKIKAIVYLDVDTRNGSDNQQDWRLTSPPGALDAYAALLTERRFQGSIH